MLTTQDILEEEISHFIINGNEGLGKRIIKTHRLPSQTIGLDYESGLEED